jgi:hypothetical protein
MKHLDKILIISTFILTGCRILLYPETRPHTEKIKLHNILDSSIVFENDEARMRFSKIDLNEILEQTKNLNKCDSIRLLRLKNVLKTNWDSKQIHLFYNLENTKYFGLETDTVSLEMKLIHILLQSKEAIILNKKTDKTVSNIHYVLEDGGYCCCHRFYRFEDGEKFFVYKMCVDFIILNKDCK